MKILDRYVISAFLKNYLLSFLVLVGMYVVLDMVFNFDEFTNVQNRLSQNSAESVAMLLRNLGRFYFYQMFLFFLHLGPIIPGVAASFTLLRMTRNNELTAILAAGVPLLRVAAPIIMIAVVLTGLGWVDQEFIIPNIIPQLLTKHNQVAGVNNSASSAKPVPPMRDSENRLLMASRYLPPAEGEPGTMLLLDVVGRDDKNRPLNHLYADKAVWDAGKQQWTLTDGFMVEGLLPEDRPTAPKPVASIKTSITPDEIALFRTGDYVDLLSTSRINQLLQRSETYGAIDLLRVKHSRVAQLLLNIILLLLAIPSVLTREPQRLRMATGQALVLTGLCLGAVFLSHNIAGIPPMDPRYTNLWPALWTWVPVFLFGPLSVYLLSELKT
jgi:lipopolysaccharide export LptBFGC system permease protein LptF